MNNSANIAAIQRPALEAFMFVRSASFVKTTAEWSALAPRRSADRAARDFAALNMVAVLMRGDDSAVSYLYDVERNHVVRTVHAKPEWVA